MTWASGTRDAGCPPTREAVSGSNPPSNRSATVCACCDRPGDKAKLCALGRPDARALEDCGAGSSASPGHPPPPAVLTGGRAGAVEDLGHKCCRLYSSFRAEAGTPVTWGRCPSASRPFQSRGAGAGTRTGTGVLLWAPGRHAAMSHLLLASPPEACFRS